MRTRLLMLLILCGTAHLVDGQSQTLPTRAGDVAAGKVMSEANGALVLNIQPCGTARLLQFHSPYFKRDQGDAQCPGGGSYRRVVVEQK